MKKPTTISAILAISMLATTAHAESINAGGSYAFEVQMGGADNESDVMSFSGGNYDFFVNAERITDSGLILIGATGIEGGAAESEALWLESTGAIISNFGTISFSNDGGSVTSMAPGANGLSISGDVDDVIKLNDNATAGDADVAPPNGGNTISYTSPNILGFKAGITLGRNGGNSEYDASKETGNDVDRSHATIVNGQIITGTLPDNADTEYAGIAFSYSLAGATVGYAIGTAKSNIDVKGFTNIVATADDDGFDEAILNGKYEEVWGGVKLSLRYTAGPLSVGYSNTNSGVTDRVIAGVKIPTPTDAGTLADLEIKETAIGVSYNYGVGTVSYVIASEDHMGKGGTDATTAETLTTNLLAVSRSIVDGINIYFENHTGSVDIDNSNEEYERVSEAIVGIKITF